MLVASVLLLAGLYAFFEYPAIGVNSEGQYALFGRTLNPPQCSGLEGIFGCHCVFRSSISYWLFRAGYNRFLGCP